jgi:hypothetical protein
MIKCRGNHEREERKKCRNKENSNYYTEDTAPAPAHSLVDVLLLSN